MFVLVFDDSESNCNRDEVKEKILISKKELIIEVDVKSLCSTFCINKKALTLFKVDGVSDTDGDHKYIIYLTYYCVYENINNIDWSPIEVVSDPDDEYDSYNTYREHKTKRDYKSHARVKVCYHPIDEDEDDDLYWMKPNKRVRSHYQAPRKTRRDYKKNYISKRDVAEMLWEE
jgi:hypothetical protein